MEFPDLGMVKLEAEHPVPSVNNLAACLEEYHPTNLDVHVSLE